MKYRDMSELCTCYTTLGDFQAELNHDADVAYQEGIVATTKYYKDFETGFIIKISYGYDEDAMNKPLTQEAFKDAPEWVKSVAVDSDGEAAWFLSKFEEKFTPNTKLANALRRYNEAINDTENPNQTI